MSEDIVMVDASKGETEASESSKKEKTTTSKVVESNNTNSKLEQTNANEGNNKTSKKSDQNDLYSVKLKPEFVLTERHSSLPPLPPPPPPEEAPIDDRDKPGNNNNHKKNKKKGRKGQNKKRPRDARPDNADRPCLQLVAGEACTFGDKCRYNHNIQEILANRPADITTIDKCPNYELHGYCEYGMMCRLGATHINLSTGENFKNMEVYTKSQHEPPSVLNILSKEVQTQLRRKQYIFKTKRYNDKHKSKSSSSNKEKTQEEKTNETTAATTETSDAAIQEEKEPDNNGTTTTVPIINTRCNSQGATTTDYSPLPTKERKLIDFRNKVYIAPLTTVGNLPFRRIMKRFGADITCGEMAVATNLLEGKSSEWALLKRHADEDVFGVQIAAGFPDVFTRTCELLEAHTTVDFVDLNCGCPLDIVCNKDSGAKLMLRDKKLKSCLEGIRSVLSCPITVKMRTGWDESKPFAHHLVPKIQSWGIDGISAVMIHGRSRLQRYSKLANWDYISQVAQACYSNTDDDNDFVSKIPILGNGDVFSYTDYEEKVAKEGISPTAMLGRGALIKPWLPTEIKERRHWDISASERLDMLKNFVKFGLEHWGSDQQGVNNTRRFLLEWLSFLHRYVPVGMLERVPQQMNQRPPSYMCGRSDLETLMLSKHASDWIKISEMLLGPVPEGFQFEPKHKASG